MTVYICTYAGFGTGGATREQMDEKRSSVNDEDRWMRREQQAREWQNIVIDSSGTEDSMSSCSTLWASYVSCHSSTCTVRPPYQMPHWTIRSKFEKLICGVK